MAGNILTSTVILERQRSTARASIAKFLGWTSFHVCSHVSCDECNVTRALYTRRLQSMGLAQLDLNKSTLGDVCDKLAAFQETDTPPSSRCANISRYAAYKPLPRHYEITADGARIRKEFSGLCLDCIKAGGINTGTCRLGAGCGTKQAPGSL